MGLWSEDLELLGAHGGGTGDNTEIKANKIPPVLWDQSMDDHLHLLPEPIWRG
jgi:hypothetical protein